MGNEQVRSYMRSDGVMVRAHSRVTAKRSTHNQEAVGTERRRQVSPCPMSPDEACEVPMSMAMWEVDRAGAPVPEKATPHGIDRMVVAMGTEGSESYSADKLGGLTGTADRQAHYTMSGASFVGLAELKDRDGRRLNYTLTPAGREYAKLPREERSRAMGAMLVNVDEVWLNEEDFRGHFGSQFNGATLDARVDCFAGWRKAAEQHLADSGMSSDAVAAYARERREEALINCADYEYNTNASTGLRAGADPLAKRPDEVLCNECFMYRRINGGCADNGQCGR